MSIYFSEPVNDYCGRCYGVGLKADDSGPCPFCFLCGYCGNFSLSPLLGRDEDGAPVHPACAPGGAHRLEDGRHGVVR